MGNLLRSRFKNNLYTREEVALHNNSSDCWIIAHKKVYDATPFINQHPGSSDIIIKRAGQDCTKDYDYHSKSSKKIWNSLHIGYIKS